MGRALAAVRIVPEAPAQTRERLLDAAEKLFAARGFRATSIRDITAGARCNLAAVNYHFGGKVSLYRAMFHRRMRALREQRIRSIESALAEHRDPSGLRPLLRSFIFAFLEAHRDESGSQHLMQLFSRELIDPHLPPNTLFREIVEPVQGALIEAIRSIGVDVGGRAARRCVHSLIAQLVHVIRIGGMQGAASASTRSDVALPDIVDHIVRFSAAGFRSYLDPAR
jgi:AcrR family transcriptional regulator